MKKLTGLFFLVAWLFGHAANAIEYPEKPNPPRLVNDYTGTLSAQEIDQLENKLVAFDDSTSTQIAVVMLNSLDGYPISEYAFQLAERWGIGQSKTNNGALLLISMQEHKLWIATGYGLEATLTDALCKRIIENDITPAFKSGQYFQGVDDGTSQIMNVVKGEYKAVARKKGKAVPATGIVLFLIFFLIIFAAKIFSVRNYAQVNSIPFWVAWSLLNAARSRQRGSWGHFSGGGGFGGGGGGGGFGGFGGGSFGGGGAGGSW